MITFLCCLSKFNAVTVNEHTATKNTHNRGATRNLRDFIGFWGPNQNVILKNSKRKLPCLHQMQRGQYSIFKETIRNLKLQHKSLQIGTTRSPAPTTFQDLTVFIVEFLTLGVPGVKQHENPEVFFPPNPAAGHPAEIAARTNLENNIPGGGQAAKGREDRKVQHSKK